MDQAMGDLQSQLDEVKRLWEEERVARQRLEVEVAALKTGQSAAPPASAHASPAVPPAVPPSGEASGIDSNGASKRALDESAGSPPPDSEEKDLQDRVKRQRLE